ncbi:hypothetical protein OS493_021746 [Desmophyllum pertusum]|uniref:Uncharacterized protein n=1 Tax=Desmophyllum pertusum TaxID=174260 RepID=A0A9W9ZZT1_9CNID|nr:hypothetical protein OS493_021746 [Desmophyllum pertusum]
MILFAIRLTWMIKVDKDSAIRVNLWIIVICAVAGVVIICVIIGISAWCVHKKRKCRKDPRVHDSAVEEQPLSKQDGTRDEKPYVHDNNGYAEAGPQSEQSQGASGPAAVPNYAV